MSKGIFITGTDTDIGKTYVTALIVKKLAEAGYDPTYYKAAASGISVDLDGTVHSDASYVKEVSGISASLDEMCPYTYVQAVSPHLACRKEGHPVDMAVVEAGFRRACSLHPYVVMEGSGGILCPIRQDDVQTIWLEDVIRRLGLSAVIVADAGLGTINHTVLTAFYMNKKGLPVGGIIFNHCHPGNVMEEDNIAMIQKLTGLPVIAKVKTEDTELDASADLLASFFKTILC